MLTKFVLVGHGDVLQEYRSTSSSSMSDHSDIHRLSVHRGLGAHHRDAARQDMLNHLRSLMRGKIVDCEEKLLQTFFSSL